MPKVTVSVTGENEFSPELEMDHAGRFFNVSVKGIFVANVEVQRKLDGGTFEEVKTFVEPSEEIGQNVDHKTKWRIGVPTGGFTSGNPVLELSY